MSNHEQKDSREENRGDARVEEEKEGRRRRNDTRARATGEQMRDI